MTANELTVEQLAQQLIAAKASENAANKIRVELEQQLIARLGQREEGSQTHELDNGFKVTITGKMSYSADMALLQQICATLPDDRRPIKTKIELDTTGAKYLRANDADTWSKLSAAITVKPAKPSVEIKA